MRETLRIAAASADASEPELRQMSSRAMAFIAGTEDFQEGPRAFIEKRKPAWTGR